MRRIVALIAILLCACGLVGSTQGYAGAFCNQFAGALFCTGFDGTTDAETPFLRTPSDANPLRVEIASAPAEAGWSQPNVLHVTSTGGMRSAFAAAITVPSNTNVVCDLDFEVLQAAGNARAMIMGLESDTTGPMAVYGAGLVIGETRRLMR